MCHLVNHCTDHVWCFQSPAFAGAGTRHSLEALVSSRAAHACPRMKRCPRQSTSPGAAHHTHCGRTPPYIKQLWQSPKSLQLPRCLMAPRSPVPRALMGAVASPRLHRVPPAWHSETSHPYAAGGNGVRLKGRHLPGVRHRVAPRQPASRRKGRCKPPLHDCGSRLQDASSYNSKHWWIAEGD